MFTAQQAAARLGVTLPQLTRAIRSGQLPPPETDNQAGVALSGFSPSWMEAAQAALARSGPAIRYVKFPDGRLVSILRKDIWEKALKAAEA